MATYHGAAMLFYNRRFRYKNMIHISTAIRHNAPMPFNVLLHHVS